MSKIGVKKFIELFKNPTDWDKVAAKLAKEKGITVAEIKKDWDDSRKRGEEIHLFLQNREKDKGPDVFSWDYTKIDLKEHFELLDVKDNPLKNNTTYLERLVYSLKYGIVGFPDKIEVKKGHINITDYKTFKKLNKTAYSIKVGTKIIKSKYNAPIEHLDDCNYIDAVLQLSLYMYLVWNANKKLKVGKLFIRHIITNTKGEIIEEKDIEVPYLRDEIRAMLDYKLKNKI